MSHLSYPDHLPLPRRPTITKAHCLQYLRYFIDKEKPGLLVFYDDNALETRAAKAEMMVNKLVEMGYSMELALDLTLLTLYDLVLLIDDSGSMETEEEGMRKETLRQTLEAITSIYDLANTTGLASIRFLNSNTSYEDIKQRDLSRMWEHIVFSGVTKIGSALSKKVLDHFVWSVSKLKKPLLVMTITDGVVEGERKALLRDVIVDCVTRLQANAELGRHAVALQFSRIGDDEGARGFLRDLANNKAVGKYVSCLDVTIPLMNQPDDRYILPKLLLGAISEKWDNLDEEDYFQAPGIAEMEMESNDEEADEEEADEDEEDVEVPDDDEEF